MLYTGPILLPAIEAGKCTMYAAHDPSEAEAAIVGIDPAQGGVSAAVVGVLYASGRLVVTAAREEVGETLAGCARWCEEHAHGLDIVAGLDPTCSRQNWQTAVSDEAWLRKRGWNPQVMRMPVWTRLCALRSATVHGQGTIDLWIEPSVITAMEAGRKHRQRAAWESVSAAKSRRWQHTIDALSYMVVAACRTWVAAEFAGREPDNGLASAEHGGTKD